MCRAHYLKMHNNHDYCVISNAPSLPTVVNEFNVENYWDRLYEWKQFHRIERPRWGSS